MKYAIIGAGIGGLATALALEQNGIDYQVYEQVPELRAVGAGIWLAPNALQGLDSFGVLEQVQEKGHSIDRITLGLSDFSVLSDSIQTLAIEKYGFATVAIHRARLQRILFEALPAERVSLGKAFEKYEVQHDQTLIIYFEDGSTTQADYLVAADGIHSKVRKQLFPGSQIRYAGQTCWRGISHHRLDDDIASRGVELWGDRIRFGLSQVAPEEVYWFAVANDKAQQEDQPGMTKKKLMELFSGFIPFVSQLIQDTPKDQIMRNDIYDLKLIPHWHQGNICLIGDAAHATTPNLGQGGAQAIEDAYYLGHLLRQHPETNVFSAFQKKRQSKVHFVVNQSWQTGQMAHWRYGQGIRNFMMRNMPKPFLNRMMMKLYEVEQFE